MKWTTLLTTRPSAMEARPTPWKIANTPSPIPLKGPIMNRIVAPGGEGQRPPQLAEITAARRTARAGVKSRMKAR
jgi:hypothetical protein